MARLGVFADLKFWRSKGLDLSRSSLPLIIAFGMLGGCWSGGCTRSSVLPPPASIPTPAPRYVPSTTQYVPRTPPATAAIVGDPWKPTTAARDWKYIVVHHTATSNGSVESIHEAHLQKKDKSGNPWLGIGYHFVIGNGNGMPDGAIEPTFRWKQQMHGAHAGSSNPEYNQQGIGICLIGNFDETPPTSAQRRSVKLLVQTLKASHKIAAANVIGHRDIRATECPGKLFPMSEVAADDFYPGRQLSEGLIPERTATTFEGTYR